MDRVASPFFGVKKLCAEGVTCAPGSQAVTASRTLQAVLAQAGGTQSIQLLVSGHLHLFQSLSFDPVPERGAPPQLVVGNGGVRTFSEFRDGAFRASIGAASADGLSSTRHGVAVIDLLDANGAWHGKAVNPATGETIALCRQPAREGPFCVQPD